MIKELKARNEEQNAINEDILACIKNLKVRIDEIDHHLHNREVVGRLEKVIGYSLMKEFNITEEDISSHSGDFENNVPRSIHLLNLCQLLNLSGFRYMRSDLRTHFKNLSEIFYHLKKDSHKVIHQQVLTPEQLEKTMKDILERARPSDGTPDRYYDIILWVYHNEKEYLKDGDIKRLRRSCNRFPHDIFSK